jgi:hypothetical protein
VAVRWPLLACVLVGVSLCLPAVGPRRVLDDSVLELALSGRTFPGLSDGLLGMFRFASGDEAENRALIDRGVLLPWWSEPDLRIAFLRPLSGLTHALDFACWPHSSRLMYAHSLAWFGLLIASARQLYERLEPRQGRARTFGATLLFAVAPAHAAAVGWLSSRNTLVASCFGLWAISAWIAGSRHRALLWLVAALLSGEVAVCALAFIVCHSWVMDPRPARARIVSLIPITIATLLWRGLHFSLGFGARGSGAYLDPLRDASALFTVLPERLVAVLGACVGLVPADLVFVGEPELVRAVLALSLAFLVAFGFAVRRWWTSDPVVRFWASSSLLAALPLCAAPPNDRGTLLLLVGIKALVVRVALAPRDGGLRRVLAAAFVGWHALGAPALLALRAGQFQALGNELTASTQVLDTIPELERRTVVVLNPPRDLFASYIQLERAARGASVAERLVWLTNASSELTVTRVAADTLEIVRKDGICSTPLERLYRRDPSTLRAGTSLDFPAFSARIVSGGGDGQPAVVRFRFRTPLEHESLVFLEWRGGRYARIEPPALGQSQRFARVPLENLL